MAQAKKTAGKTAPQATPVATLSRGQKAAATRRANKEKAAKAHAAKVKGVKLSTRAKVPTKKERTANLAKLVREQKARDKRKAALKKEREAVASQKERSETLKRAKGVLAIRTAGRKAADTGTLGLLRHAAVLVATKGKRTSYDYAAGLNAKWPGWLEFKEAEAKTDTNHGIIVAAFLAEKKAFYEDFRANFDGVGDCNPSATWANIRKYAGNLLVNGIPKPRGGAAKIGLDKVAIRDLEKLYLRINNQKEEDFDANPKLAEAAKQVLGVLAFLGANVGAINAKITPKK